jgi:hypothetical protein
VLTAVVDQRWSQRRPLPLGAFAINKHAPDLTVAINRVLDRYLGSPDHLALMERYGFSRNDLATILHD